MNGRLYKLFLLAIITLAVVVRLYKINGPIADWHSFRQADTASVARNFEKYGFDLLHPRYDDLSNIQSGKDNPMGWRMVEVPLYQYVAALGHTVIGLTTIEVWLRMITILASMGTTAWLIYLVSQTISPLAGLSAGFLYAILPYSIYYGRTILPESFGVFWGISSVGLVYQAGRGKGKDWVWIISASLCGAIALLVKPTIGFLLIPVPYLIYRQWGMSLRTIIRFVVYGAITVLPLLWWRHWILQYPEGIPVYEWLFNEGNIRFKGAWFWWLFAIRIGELMLGNWGLIFLGMGCITKPTKKEGWIWYWLGLGALLYVSVFAAGNVRHDYYQIIVMPFITIMASKGIYALINYKEISLIKRISTVFVIVLFMLGFSWYTVRTYYWINRPDIVEAGQIADKLLPPDAKVIAPYNGDTSFLYQTNRQGWPLGFEIDKKIAMGATAYVTVSPTDNDFETKELAQKYTVLVRNDKFAIIDLTKLR